MFEYKFLTIDDDGMYMELLLHECEKVLTDINKSPLFIYCDGSVHVATSYKVDGGYLVPYHHEKFHEDKLEVHKSELKFVAENKIIESFEDVVNELENRITFLEESYRSVIKEMKISIGELIPGKVYAVKSEIVSERYISELNKAAKDSGVKFVIFENGSEVVEIGTFQC